ncbi:MAG TPA: 1,4-dihydroxy-6-naphthoate synthase [Flavitalea sp.]|nr:1,4-dihydroxy-6-naphthoate synthase [Flavitalea sp.]
MKYTIGFSPCPNDTFIFDALVNGLIDNHGIQVEPILEDVQTLNEWAIQGKLDISKISYGVLPQVLDEYNLLDAGGALGKGVGPLLISKSSKALSEVENYPVALPGNQTTAHMLFALAFPQAKQKIFLRYDKIEEYVQTHPEATGVIIHENRFTYKQKGLFELMDLGKFWEERTKGPVPLGGIVIRRSIDHAIQVKINDLISKSLRHAQTNYPFLSFYVKKHAQEMSEDVMRQHISLYVNEYSLSIGTEGKNAVETLLRIAKSHNVPSPNLKEPVFLLP